MSAARTVVVAVVGLILQLTVSHGIAVAGAIPDFIIVILVAVVLNRNPIAAVIIGFCLGFLQDLANPVFLGMNAFSKSLLAYGVSRIGGGYLPHNLFYFVLLIFSSCLVNDIIVLNITYSFSFLDVLSSFFRYSLLSAIYSSLIGGMLYIVSSVFELTGVGAGSRRNL